MDRHEVFGQGLEREASVQAGAAGKFRIAARECGAAGARDRLAVRGSERLRSDRGEGSRTVARGPRARGAWHWRPEVRRIFPRAGASISLKRGCEDRLRRCARAQDRSRSGHVPDAVALRTVRLESDLQLEVWYGANRSCYGRS